MRTRQEVKLAARVHTAAKMLAARKGISLRSFVEEAILKALREATEDEPELATALDIVLNGKAPSQAEGHSGRPRLG